MRTRYFCVVNNSSPTLWKAELNGIFVLANNGQWITAMFDIKTLENLTQEVYLYQVRSLFPELKQHKLKCKSQTSSTNVKSI